MSNGRNRSAAWILIASMPLAFACAKPPAAESPIDWDAADVRWSILVVTEDPDGSDRVTRIWTALLDGRGVIRTNESRWWANVRRGSRLRVRHAGEEHAFFVETVDDRAGREAIDEVFLEKYGWWERLLFPQPRGETHANYGRLIPE